jgi:hypothetical protein
VPEEIPLSVTTDEPAQCRFAMKPDVDFDEMTPFATTGEKAHATRIKGLKKDAANHVYIKARDVHGNVSDEDFDLILIPTDAKFAAGLESEAEDCKVLLPAIIVEDKDASKGLCVTFPAPNEGKLSFTVNAPTTDTYVVWVRAFCPSEKEDSTFVSLDGAGEDVFDMAEGPNLHGKWRWVLVNGRAGGDKPLALNPRGFSLKQGEHTITFRSREFNVRIDRIIVTRDRGFTPKD